MNDQDTLVQLAGRCDANTGVDVVFVHGAEADAESGWHPLGHPELSMPRMLAADLPYVCAWSLNYSMSVFRLKTRALPLEDQATNAILELVTKRIGRGPVVFVAHSVGGLLVKHALRLAKNSRDPMWRSVLERTIGIVFLSTPHFGLTNLEKWRGVPLLQQPLIADLTDVEGLRDLNASFQAMVREHSIKVAVFYEGEPTRRGPWRGVLVSKESADPDIPNVVPHVINVVDHDRICRPATKDDQAYIWVRDFVRGCFASASEKVFLSYAHEDTEWMQRLQRQLEPLTRDGTLHVWADSRIIAGDAWSTTIRKHLESARVAVLFVSQAFLDSEYIVENELPILLEKADYEGLTLLFIAVTPFDRDKLSFKYTLASGGQKEFDLAAVQWISPPEKPIAEMSTEDRDRAFAKLAAAIQRAVKRQSGPTGGKLR